MAEEKVKKTRAKKVVTEEKVSEEIPIIGDTPPSVTLDEVKEVKEPVETEKNNPSTDTEAVKITDKIGNVLWDSKGAELRNEELPMEQKIINFIESRGGGEIRMNDFLKSLYGVPKFNQPPLWVDKGEMKRLRLILIKLQDEGYMTFTNNSYLQLGQFYHSGEDQKTSHHNLNTIQLVAKK